MSARRRIWAAVALLGALATAQALSELQVAPALDARLLALGGAFAILVGAEGALRPEETTLPVDERTVEVVVYAAVVAFAGTLATGLL